MRIPNTETNMKQNFLLSIMTVSFLLVATTALAGGGPVVSEDADGDGFSVPIAPWTAQTAGIESDELDCDDANKHIYPGSTTWIDGEDHDCRALTPKGLPGTEKERALFGITDSSDPQSVIVFAVTWDRCAAGAALTTPTCAIDKKAGQFNPATGWMLEDLYKGNSTLVGHDGYPDLFEDNVATQRDRETLKHREAKEAKPAYRGPGKKQREEEAREVATAVSAEGDEELRKEVLEITSGLESDIEELEGVVEVVTDQVNINTDAVLDLSGGLTDETDARVNADNALWDQVNANAGAIEVQEGQIDSLGDDVDAVEAVASANASTGIKVGFGGQGGFNGHRPLGETQNGEPTGEYLRGTGTAGGGFDLTAGVDLAEAYTGGFGSVSFGYDGVGEGADRVFLVGGEALAEIPGAPGLHVGGFGAYRRTEAHANSVDATVYGDAACGGASAFWEIQSNTHVSVEPFVRVGACHEWYGTKGTVEVDGALEPAVQDGTGWGGMAQGGLRITVTSASRR